MPDSWDSNEGQTHYLDENGQTVGGDVSARELGVRVYQHHVFESDLYPHYHEEILESWDMHGGDRAPWWYLAIFWGVIVVYVIVGCSLMVIALRGGAS